MLRFSFGRLGDGALREAGPAVKVEDARDALAVAVENGAAGETGYPSVDNFVLRGEVLGDVEIQRFELERELGVTVATDVSSAAQALTRKQFVAYDPSYQTASSQVLVEALREVPELAAVDEVVRRGDVPSDDGGRPVVAMVHAVGAGEAKVVAYRLKGQGIATRRARGIPLVPRDGVYRQVGGDILYYEPRFDAFTCAGFVFFVTATLIQSKLQAPQKARSQAKRALAAATANVAIEGYAELEIAVMDDPALRAKMASVARLLASDPQYGRHLTTEKLVQFVEGSPEYDIQLVTRDGGTVLAFDSRPQHRHQIPRLLADDYLHSFLTDRKYEAGSKQQLGG